MDNSSKYTCAIIGLGRIGFSLGFDKLREQPASHTMALKRNSKINIVAGCDINPENLYEWQKYNKKASIYRNVDDLFKNIHADIVTVAVNEENHLPVAIKAIQTNPKLVILEKPVALNTSDAFELQKVSEKFKVPILVNHERRFALDYNLALDCLDSIGSIQEIHASLYSGLRVYSAKEEATGAYSLLHDGTHLVDILLFFLEKIESKNVVLKNPQIHGLYRDEKGDVRNVSAIYSFASCPLVEINISGRSKFFGFGLEILGTEGKISVGNGYFEVFRRKPSKLYSGFYSLEKDKKIRKPKKTLYFSNMISNAVDFLDGKSNLKSTLQTGINALSVLEEIKASIK